MEKTNHLGDVSVDMLFNIISFLNPSSILSFMRVNSTFYEIFNTDSECDVWKHLFLTQFKEVNLFFEYFQSSKEAFKRCIRMSSGELDFKTLINIMKLSFSKGNQNYRLILFDLYFLLPLMKKTNSYPKYNNSVNLEPSLFLGFILKVIRAGMKDDPLVELFMKRWKDVYLCGEEIPIHSDRFKELGKFSRDHVKLDDEILCGKILYITMYYMMKSVFHFHCNNELGKGIKIMKTLQETFFDHFVFYEYICILRPHFVLEYGKMMSKTKPIQELTLYFKTNFDNFFDPNGAHIDFWEEYDRRRYQIMQEIRDLLTLYTQDNEEEEKANTLTN